MALRSDERAQSIQIGAILIFGILVVAFSTYQAFVVPSQNREVEFNHNQRVGEHLHDLRNAIVSTASDGADRSVSVPLGTRYPSRLVARNPTPPSGSLRTVGTRDAGVNASIANATAGGETGDFWDGTTRTYTTGGIDYRPDYREYAAAPTTSYANTVLYDRFRSSNRTRTDQQLVDGDRISLVALNGSLGVSRADSVSVSVEPASASTRTVAITNASAGGNVTITVPTRLPESAWRDLLAGEFTGEGGHVYAVGTEPLPDAPFRLLHVRLEPGVTYRLRTARIGVGNGVERPDAAYAVDVRGNGSGVPEGTSRQLVLEVRDRFDNPVSGVTVNASTGRGDSALRATERTTDEEGRVAFTYEAPDDVDGGPEPDSVNASFAVDPDAVPGFVAGAPENVSFSLRARNTDGSGTGGGDGAYTLQWNTTTIDTEPGVSGCHASNDTCVYDLDDDTDDGFLTLTANTIDPTTTFAAVDFAANDSSVLSNFDPSENTTDGAGAASTNATIASTGTVSLLVSSSEDADEVALRVRDSGGSSPSVTITEVEGSLGPPTDSYEVEADVSDPDGDLDRIEYELQDSGGNTVATATDSAVGGGSDESSETLSASGGDRDSEYDIVVTVFDSESNTGTERTTESGSKP